MKVGNRPKSAGLQATGMPIAGCAAAGIPPDCYTPCGAVVGTQDPRRRLGLFLSLLGQRNHMRGFNFSCR